jgi:hypothetical protein
LKSGYRRVDIHPEDKKMTAFSTGSGLYQFNVMPFFGISPWRYGGRKYLRRTPEELERDFRSPQ